MERGKELEKAVYQHKHIQDVLAEIEKTFPRYFSTFSAQPISLIFTKYIQDFEKEQPKYREYLDPNFLIEFEDNPDAFKQETKRKCPIIQKCLMSNDEIMKQYKVSFHDTSGRKLLDAVTNIANFGIDYAAEFDDGMHEHAVSYEDLNLSPLSQEKYGTIGVIGYGIQSSLLYGKYPRIFAHRSQNAVWTLYFITNRKDFGLEDASEFLMVQPKYGTCEQNFFYPAELFGFYALKLYLLLKQACSNLRIKFYDRYRYIYLAAFTDHIADSHREDINALKWTSDHVESHWY